MEIGNFKMHRRAAGTFGQLEPHEQNDVRTRLALFSEIPVAQWPPALVKRLPVDEPIYLMRINDRLRAFVQAGEGQQPEVLELAPQAQLDALANATPRDGK
jgi:hypothetical protein